MTKGAGARDRDGFTIAEVVVASAILLIVVAGIFGAVFTARRIVSINENRLVCLHYARSVLEFMAKHSYDDDIFDIGQTQLPDNRGVIKVTKDPNKSLKHVEVTVRWMEPSGHERSVTLHSSHSRSLHR